MGIEAVEIKRTDYHFAHLKKAKLNVIEPQERKARIDSIGVVRITDMPNGSVLIDANLLGGVKVELPDKTEEKIEQPSAGLPTRNRLYYLEPGNHITLERPRLLRGKTIVRITHNLHRSN